ncbi:MAG: hypothetical protein KJZ78_26665, partial [Bryobacteraceae bacterium]|nr:hypothetical protein [Bryobacteraceae bacterium]
MFNRRCTAHVGFVSLTAALLWAATSATALAQCGGHGGHGGDNHAAAGDSHAGHSDHQYHMPPGGLPRRVERT